jgi:hypothetical protein
MKLLRFNESIEQDNIKDYFIDFIDDDFTFSIEKTYWDEREFNCKTYPFNGCSYIEHSIDITLKKSKEYKKYQEEFIEAINRCCESEGFEIKNYKLEHFFGGTHNYHFKCSLKEPFDEKVDETTQFINDFIAKIKQKIHSNTYNVSFGNDDIIIESKGENVIIRSTGRINTQSKFKTLSNWVKESSFANPHQVSHYSPHRLKATNGYYTFDVKVQVPRFENENMVRPGILTISNIKIVPNR